MYVAVARLVEEWFIPSLSARHSFPEFYLASDMSDGDDETVVPVSSGQFAQLLEAINSSQTRMEERFEEFRTEVRQGQEDAAAKALKRAKYEKPYTYQRKGNEEQATFLLLCQ